MNRNVFLQWLLMLAIVCGCAEEKASGPIEVQLIQPTGPHCAYAIAAAPLQTLDSLTTMHGKVGRVVTTNENLSARAEILDSGAGLVPVDVQFASSGSLYSPLDLNSLFAVSLYYAIETGYLLFARLDPSADMATVVPDLYNTSIVHEAKRSFGEVGKTPEENDNAEYLPHVASNGRGQSVVNYFFSFPTDEITAIPLGLNLGVMVHEFSHLVMNFLHYERAGTNAAGSGDVGSTNTLASLDEGLADYFGFLATKDPAFFDCSFANSGRDLSQPKSFTDDILGRLQSDPDFDSHEAGAVFAAINYEIGQSVGPDVNGRGLIRLMSALAGCTGSGGMNFNTIASCHAGVSDAAAQATVQQAYAKYGVGGGR